ncbi:SAM-dependent methyltransferase, partial [Pantoea graminicola]
MWLLSWSTSVWGADYRQIRLNLHLLIRSGCVRRCLLREITLLSRYTH